MFGAIPAHSPFLEAGLVSGEQTPRSFRTIPLSIQRSQICRHIKQDDARSLPFASIDLILLDLVVRPERFELPTY
jgi:hypothetical protein